MDCDAKCFRTHAAHAVATDLAAVPEPLIDGADALDNTVALEAFIELCGARQSEEAADQAVAALSTRAELLLFDAIGGAKS